MARNKVSVVIPTYGRTEYLLRAISSVENQTYENIELTVVDDNSPQEGKSEEVKKYIQNLNIPCDFIQHEVNKGGNAARKTGIEASSGAFLAFLDDDDWWEPDKLEKQVNVTEKNDADLVYTGVRFVNEDGSTLKERVPGSVPSDATKKLLCRNIIGTYSSILLRSSVIDEVGYPDENFPAWQDQEWFIRISKGHKLQSISKALVNYSAESPDKITDSIISNANTLEELFLEKFSILALNYGPRFYQRMKAWVYHRLGNAAFLHDKFNKSIRYQLKAISSCPFFWRPYIVLMASITRSPGKRLAYETYNFIEDKKATYKKEKQNE